MSRRPYLLPAVGLAVSMLAAAPAFAAAAPPDGACIYANAWQDWSSPAPNVILLRVNVDDVYQLDLKYPSNQLKYPAMHLVNLYQTSQWLCRPSDFNLLLKDNYGGFSEPLFVTRITKLTPAEVAAIPRKLRP